MMKRLLALMALMLIPSLAGAQNLSLQVNSPFAALLGPNGNLTVTGNLLDQSGTTSNLAACPGVSYVDRTQSFFSAVSGRGVNLNVEQPPEAQTGDFDVVFCTSDSSTPLTGPAGWTQLTPNATNSQGDVTSAWYRRTIFGDPNFWTWTGGNWPKCVMRSYRGMTGIDTAASIPAVGLTNNIGSTLILSSLPATVNPCEILVAYAAQHGAPGAQLTSIGGLVETTADNAGWSDFEGNALAPATGTTLTTGLGVSSTDSLDGWTGFVLTLHP